MNKIYQGHVATDGSTKIFCTGNSMLVKTIIINNIDSNYVFNFNRFMDGPGIHLIPIYEFTLDAGDTIRDEDEYLLDTNDFIQLISNVPGTTYYIRTEET